MSRVAAEISKIREANRDIARLACHIADLRPDALTHERVHDHQDWMRRQRLWAEHRLRTLRARVQPRKKRLKRCTGPARGVINKVLIERERALEIQVRVLRQIGDTIAWRVLRGDPRLLAALYAERTHHLPVELGIGGPLLVARKPRESGDFYVIENDLTRVLGRGDLTAVWATRQWTRPLCLEVKARGLWVEGGTAELGVSAIAIDMPVDRELYAAFCRVAGLQDPPPDVTIRDDEQQTAGMLAGGELMLRVTEQRPLRLPAGSPHVWRTIANVLTRALGEGASYDLVERGVGVAGVRATDGPDSLERSEEVFQRLRELGLDAPVGSAEDFLTTAPWSALVAPIPLWPLPRDVRVALLVGELFFVAVASHDVWQDAMIGAGLRLEERDNGWLLVSPHGSRFLDRVDILRLTLGVAFSGFSPREAARDLARSLEGTPETGPQEPV